MNNSIKNSKSGANSRFREFFASTGLKLGDFSDRLGVSKSTIEKYFFKSAQEKTPSPRVLEACSTNFGVSMEWILLGVGSMYGDENSTSDDDYTAQIPRYNVTVSAGHGAAVDGETVENYYAFSARWIKSRGLSADQLCVVTASGDSMEPRLHHGDLIMVDRSQTTIADGVAYVIRWGDDVLVKYVQRIGRDKISLLSENPRYAPRDVDLSQPDDMEIIGRVVGSLHEW